MSNKRILKTLHLVGAGWFAICMLYMLIIALRQAGLGWWIIFSLSGHSAVLILVLLSVHLYAIYRGATRSKLVEREHPLTSTTAYMVFYFISPLLGALAAIAAMFDVRDVPALLLGISYSTAGATFLSMIILDPLLSLGETMLPASRRYRAERLEKARKLREAQQQQQQRLLKQLEAQENSEQQYWGKLLRPYAETMAGLTANNQLPLSQRHDQTVEIGLKAWEIGGMACMQQLHTMVQERYRREVNLSTQTDTISLWWDGIGSWRHQPLKYTKTTHK